MGMVVNGIMGMKQSTVTGTCGNWITSWEWEGLGTVKVIPAHL